MLHPVRFPQRLTPSSVRAAELLPTGFSSDASRITIKLTVFDTNCMFAGSTTPAFAEDSADEIDIYVEKHQAVGAAIHLEPSPNWVFTLDHVCVNLIMQPPTLHALQESELVVLVNGEQRAFFRFNNMVSARLFAMQIRNLQSFFLQ